MFLIVRSKIAGLFKSRINVFDTGSTDTSRFIAEIVDVRVKIRIRKIVDIKVVFLFIEFYNINHI